ncbi:hypothetical protein SAMN05421781_0572 [Marinococcus luteus]|uniref:D-alanyl-D-alanine carboxypeptidase n=1 Tax=Marinococcus luteus TaxID=1122204 RepID=A0A1H2R2Y9_9BACI|nr:hypothetical protein [Marinococcus luteus]SDW13793.1 hypothetical protein SAMN05421781_0572 [Marinococcus luteus]
MAFGIKAHELRAWKRKASAGEVALLTHYWYDPRFPDCDTVTKASCRDVETLARWGRQYGLKAGWIHYREDYPHFDLLGDYEAHILSEEKQWTQMQRFGIQAPRSNK